MGRFVFLNHHDGRTDESTPRSLAAVLSLAFHWSDLLDDEWIGMRPVGGHDAEVYVFERGPWQNQLTLASWEILRQDHERQYR